MVPLSLLADTPMLFQKSSVTCFSDGPEVKVTEIKTHLRFCFVPMLSVFILEFNLPWTNSTRRCSATLLLQLPPISCELRMLGRKNSTHMNTHLLPKEIIIFVNHLERLSLVKTRTLKTRLLKILFNLFSFLSTKTRLKLQKCRCLNYN